MTTATHGDWKVVPAGEADTGDHIRRAGASRDIAGRRSTVRLMQQRAAMTAAGRQETVGFGQPVALEKRQVS